MSPAGDHFPRVPAGVPARLGSQNEGVHFHAGRLDLPQGRGGARDVHHCRRHPGGAERNRQGADVDEGGRFLRRDWHLESGRLKQVSARSATDCQSLNN